MCTPLGRAGPPLSGAVISHSWLLWVHVRHILQPLNLLLNPHVSEFYICLCMFYAHTKLEVRHEQKEH